MHTTSPRRLMLSDHRLSAARSRLQVDAFAGARDTTGRAFARVSRRHGRDLCRAALDVETWADDSDFEEMLHQQDLAEDYEEILERRAERVADARRMREMALATLEADAELWSGIENKY